jgi:Fe-S cluster assembly protein SufD
MPSTTDESWRFTDLRGFDADAFDENGHDPESFVRNGHVPGSERKTGLPETIVDVDTAGLIVVREAGISVVRSPDPRVTFEPFTDHERLGTLVGTDEKFAAHNAAVWDRGLLVVVPRGVELEQPLAVRIVNSTEGGALFFRLLVVAEPESRFTLVEEYASSSPELSGYTNTVTELFVEQAAKLEYVSIQNLSRDTWHFASHHARVERDAELDWVAGGFGSRRGKVWIQNDLAGQGATSRVTGAYFADGDQHLDYDTYQLHQAPNTTSDFAFKGALRDKATAVWRGMIRVEKDAQRTNAYQENRNLMLSPTTHAVPIPGLEILANDVRCTHGATVGQVDRDQLFYLMARGLPRSEAERLIVRGFFTDVLDRVELEPVREALGEALEARIPQA